MYISHFLFFSLVTAGAAYLMLVAGVRKRALEWKRRARVCPSCGRDARKGCRCAP